MRQLFQALGGHIKVVLIIGLEGALWASAMRFDPRFSRPCCSVKSDGGSGV